MREDVKSILLNAVITLVITTVLQGLVLFIFHSDAIIELSSSKIEEGKYENVISIKNMNNNKYLNEFSIIVDDSIDTKDRNIVIDKIEPSKVKNIVFYSDKVVIKKDISVINNDMRIEVNSLNEYTDYKVRYLVLVLIYILINSIIIYYSYKKMNKEKDKYNKDFDEVKKEYDCLLKKVDRLEEKSDVLKIAHSKECYDLEKENEFYKSLCLKLANNNYSKEELEGIVRKELKIFSKKDIKHMNYEDIISISTLLYRNAKEENLNKDNY